MKSPQITLLVWCIQCPFIHAETFFENSIPLEMFDVTTESTQIPQSLYPSLLETDFTENDAQLIIGFNNDKCVPLPLNKVVTSTMMQETPSQCYLMTTEKNLKLSGAILTSTPATIGFKISKVIKGVDIIQDETNVFMQGWIFAKTQPNTQYKIEVDWQEPQQEALIYKMLFQSTEKFDAYEVNDDIHLATHVEGSQVIKASLDSPSDIDVYKYTLGQRQHYVNIHLKGKDFHQLLLLNGQSLQKIGQEPVQLTAAPKSTVYFAVVKNNDSTTITQAEYSLRLSPPAANILNFHLGDGEAYRGEAPPPAPIIMELPIVTGKVVDNEGKPVVEEQVGVSITLELEKDIIFEIVTTNKDGLFEFKHPIKKCEERYATHWKELRGRNGGKWRSHYRKALRPIMGIISTGQTQKTFFHHWSRICGIEKRIG